ncbi:MAG: hypothetical protein R3E95_20985 [Thiolinea sp.]
MFALYLADTAWWWMGAYHFVPQDVVYENDDAIRDGALGEENCATGWYRWKPAKLDGDRLRHAGQALASLAARKPVRAAWMTRPPSRA